MNEQDIFRLLGERKFPVPEYVWLPQVGNATGFGATRLPLGEVIVFSALETGIWAVWLLLWAVPSIGITVAVTFLFAALVVEHTVSKNVHERRGLFDEFFNFDVVPHTIVEVVACSGWLLLVREGQPIWGIAVLFAGSLIEHVIAVRGTEVS